MANTIKSPELRSNREIANVITGRELMFIRLAPQKVRHSLGYVVQVADRTTVEYLDQGQRALVEADFGSSVCIYEKTLQFFGNEGNTPIGSERKVILDRIVVGLEAMGIMVEIC